jgi:hypothetical protein
MKYFSRGNRRNSGAWASGETWVYAAKCAPAVIALIAMLLITPGVFAEGSWGFVDLIVTFESTDIDRTPAIDGATLRIDGVGKSTSIGALTRVISCKPLVADQLSPEFSFSGPWMITVFTSESPESLLQAVLLESSVAKAMLQQDAGEFASERTLAYFPDDDHDLFCSAQSQLHRRVVTEVPLAGDECGPSRPAPDCDMDLPQAWGISRGDSSIVVAVIDGGFDLFHPGLGGPGPDFAVTDSLAWYNRGIWYRNWREVIGQFPADTDTFPGIGGVDEDNNGVTDEDAWGNLPGEPREADPSVHRWTSIGAYTFTNTNAQWEADEFVGMRLYLTEKPYTSDGVYELIRSNTATEITTWGTYVIDLMVANGFNGWEYLSRGNGRVQFKICDGEDQDGDGEVDDFGYVGSPYDDDENGYEDDVRGWDFVASSRMLLGPVLSCDREDYCTADNDPRSMWDHGTSVASQVATVETDGRMMGVAPKVKILPVRVGCILSCGTELQTYSPYKGLGIDYARKMGADIISISVPPNRLEGIPSFPHDEVRRALDAGIVVVAGAGNEVFEADVVGVEEVVWVAGLETNDVRWDWEDDGESNYGAWVDVAALAAPVTMAVWGALPYPGSLNGWLQPSEWHTYGYEPLDPPVHTAHGGFGTSLSVPMVAGVAALVKSTYPHWTRSEIVNKISLSTDNIYGDGLNDRDLTWLGNGRVNAYRALTFYGNLPAASDTTWAHNIWIGGDVEVPEGRTLTIAAGDTVRVAIDDLLHAGANPNEIEFVIDGALHVNGTPSAPVVFESFGGSHHRWLVGEAITISGETFTIGGLGCAQIASDANSPLMPGVSSASQVFSVEITHVAALDSVKVDLSGLGLNATTLHLRDDGQGEDIVAADGIYTSAPFAAMLSVGNGYSVDVTAYASGGGYRRRSVAVEVPQVVAKFTDVSSQTGLDYQGTPFSAASAKMSADSGMIVTTSDQEAPTYDRIEVLPTGAPRFSARGFAASPIGGRGVAFADFDNDGDEDLFVAHAQSPKLYRNDAGNFVDVTNAMGLSTLAAGSVTGCWGDYDNDGWLDLFVTRCEVPGAEPPDKDNITFAQHRLFRNTCGSGCGFVDVTAAAGFVVQYLPVAASASWGDLENDGDLDLVIVDLSDLGYGNSAVFVNQGNGTFSEERASRLSNGIMGGYDIDYGTGVVWADMNNDGDLDIVVSCASPGSGILFNDGTGVFPADATVRFPSGAAGYGGLQVFDHNLDGWQDVFMLSRTANEPSRLFLANPTQDGVIYLENTHNAALAHTSSGMGSLAADYTSDGDMDLFVGRPVASGEFFYKTDSQVDANSLGQRYVKLRLVSPNADNANRQGIGAAVTVTAGGLVQTAQVDGGSGRGGQRDRTLTFGLGDYTGPITATIRWPGGTVQSDVDLIASGAGAGETVNIVSDAAPTVSNVNVATLVVPGTTFFDWVFTWDTDAACKAANDVLTFDQLEIANPCWPGWTTVTPATTGITYTYAAKSGGGYTHTIRIDHEDCNLNCSFRYTVSSDGGLQSATSPTKTKVVKFCPSGF